MKDGGVIHTGEQTVSGQQMQPDQLLGFQVPVPAASPVELLQQVRNGMPEFALRRVVAVAATQALLSKHLAQVAASDTPIGKQM